tara:strand:- start:1435 stop:1992 length:558 start_codon:yes stop_codon:yes gene_type:complete
MAMGPSPASSSDLESAPPGPTAPPSGGSGVGLIRGVPLVLGAGCLGLGWAVLVAYSLSLLSKHRAQEVEASCPGRYIHQALGAELGVALALMVALVGRVMVEKTRTYLRIEAAAAMLTLPVPIWAISEAYGSCGTNGSGMDLSGLITVLRLFGFVQVSLLSCVCAQNCRAACVQDRAGVNPVSDV